MPTLTVIPELLRRAIATWTPWFLAAVALIQPTAALTATLDWRADLLAHFREPALLASVVAGLAWLRARRALALAFGLLALAQGWGLARCEWPDPVGRDPGSTARLRVLIANVLTQNEEREPLIRLIRRERPDVVGLIEISAGWLADLGPIRSEYPYRLELPADARGLALWSRIPFSQVEGPEPLAPGGNPAFGATLDFAGHPLRFWLVHNVSPFERTDELPQGGEFAGLAARVRTEGGSTVVAGDLNCTDGSPYFGRFLRDSGLRDSRIGHGRQPSWPTWSYYRISIDHALISGDLAVVDRRLGPPIGSDHLPVFFELAPARSAPRPATKVVPQASQSSPTSGSSAANLARSARRRKLTSSAERPEPSRSARAGSAAISSVVFDPQDGP